MNRQEKVLVEVTEVTDNHVLGIVRLPQIKNIAIMLPRFICPENTYSGGSFYIQTKPVDPAKEQKELEGIFKGI